MSATESKPRVPLTPLNLKELTEVLIRHYGLTEGQYEIQVNYQVGAGVFGPSPEQVAPGLAVSFQQIGLTPSLTPNPLTIDAAKVGKRKKKSSAE